MHTEPAEVAAYQPALTRWGHTWRLLLMVALSAVAWPQYALAQWERARGLFWLDLGVGLVAFVLVHLRRRHPLVAALLLNALAAVSGLAAGPALLAAVSLATRRRVPSIVAVGVVSFAAGVAYAVIEPREGPSSLWLESVASLIAVLAVLFLGMYIGSRRELLWTLRQRAERAEAEAELRMVRAQEQERARIAREMHDVLAHRISQISMRAGALAFREDLSADQLRAESAVVRDTAHAALADLRGVLGVLRDGRTGERLEAPQPTYADVAPLVAQASSLGQRVELLDEVPDATTVPDQVGRTAFRIVQEGLTNARKHAPGTLVTVRLSGGPEHGLDVCLRNPRGLGRVDATGAGLGLVGLTERATLGGGRLEATDQADGFELHVWLPWEAA